MPQHTRSPVPDDVRRAEDDYGTPAYSALAGAGFGIAPEIFGIPPQDRSGFAEPRRRGPKGYRRSDERLHEQICEHLMRDEYIDSSDVSVQVDEGKVTLEGTVPERRMKYLLEDLADRMGAQDIDNAVRVIRRDTR